MAQTAIRVGIIGVHPDRGWASTAHVPALRDLPQFRLSALSHNRMHVPFAHTMDALAFALDEDFLSASGTLVTYRATIRIVESREVVPLAVADQIAFTGRLASGALVTSHFRGGLSHATNFHLEINGSKGDLLLPARLATWALAGSTSLVRKLARTSIPSPSQVTSGQMTMS
jgi:predicted dehydrogenase